MQVKALTLDSAIAHSERNGGVWLENLAVGEAIQVLTTGTPLIIHKKETNYTIVGDPKHCPEETKALINGSTWGGSMLKMKFVGIGMYLEYKTPAYTEAWVLSPLILKVISLQG